MVLTGLPNYEVFFNDGEVKVWSLVRRRWVKKHTETSQYFHLSANGRRRNFSPGFLRFLMLHPDVDAWKVNPVESRIKFTEDGTVIGLYSGPRKDRYNIFSSVDDALATVLVMKAAESGDLSFVYQFIKESRENAIWTVAGLLKTTAEKVRESVAQGEERFVKQISSAGCERIIPLYAWLCKCIKSEMLSRRKMVSIEGKGLASSKILSEPFE